MLQRQEELEQGIKGSRARSRIPDKLCEHIVEICEKGDV